MVDLKKLFQGNIPSQNRADFPFPGAKELGKKPSDIRLRPVVDLIVAVAAEAENVLFPIQAYRQLIFSVDGRFVRNPTCRTVWVGAIGSQLVVEIKPGCVTALPDLAVL